MVWRQTVALQLLFVVLLIGRPALLQKVPKATAHLVTLASLSVSYAVCRAAQGEAADLVLLSIIIPRDSVITGPPILVGVHLPG